MDPDDSYGNDIKSSEKLRENSNEKETSSKIAALFGEPVHHDGRGIKSDRPNDDNIYVDTGYNRWEKRNR